MTIDQLECDVRITLSHTIYSEAQKEELLIPIGAELIKPYAKALADLVAAVDGYEDVNKVPLSYLLNEARNNAKALIDPWPASKN